MKQFSIFNSQFSVKQEGFTLIELLVAVSVIGIAGVVVTSILVSTLRGSTKTIVVSGVKQNGSYAMTQMSRVIRGATTLDISPCGNPSPATKTLTVTQLDSSQTIFDCTGDTITANGNALLDTTTVQLVPDSCSFVCTQQTVTDIPVLQIKFSLRQKNVSNLAEQTATIPFQTAVVLRNVQQ